jgi:hypothetical protein
MNPKKHLENRIRGWFPKEPNAVTGALIGDIAWKSLVLIKKADGIAGKI